MKRVLLRSCDCEECDAGFPKLFDEFCVPADNFLNSRDPLLDYLRHGHWRLNASGSVAIEFESWPPELNMYFYFCKAREYLKNILSGETIIGCHCCGKPIQVIKDK